MAERTIKITIVGDASKASKAMADAGTSAGTLEGKVEGLSTKWGNFGTVFAGVVAGGALQKVGGWLKDGAAGAAEDTQAMDRLKIAVENSGASYDDYGKTIDDAIARGQDLAFTDGETATALSALVSMTGDTDEAMRRLSTAQDLARGTGMDLETAAKLLGKVTDENATVLQRYGINVEAGADAQAVMNEVDSRYGGQAATFAESDSAKWLKLTQQLGEVQETIGGMLIPVMTLLVGAVSAVFTAIDPVIQLIAANLTPVLIGLGAAVTTLAVLALPALIAAATTFATLTLPPLIAGGIAFAIAWAPVVLTVLAVAAAAVLLYTAWQSNFLGIQDITQQVIGFIGPYITGAIDAIRTRWETVWNAIKTAFEIVWTVISTAAQIYLTPLRVAIETGINLIQTHWETVWNAIRTVLETVWGVISTVAEIYLTPLRTAIETGINLISENWATVWGAVQSAIEAIWGPIQTAVSTGIDAVSTGISTVLGPIQENWDTIWGAIKTTISTVWDVASGIASIVSTGIDAVKSKIDEVLGTIQEAWDTAWGAVKGSIDTIFNGVNGILRIADGGISSVRTKISEVLNDIKDNIWDPIWNSFTGVVTTVMDAVKLAVNTVISGINGVIGVWNSLSFKVPELDMGPLGTWGGMEIGTNRVDPLTPLATGGIVLKPISALVGEAGPEAIVPLSQLPGIIKEAFADQERTVNLPPGTFPSPDEPRVVNLPPGTFPDKDAPMPPPVFAERDPLTGLMKPSQNGPGSNSMPVARGGLSKRDLDDIRMAMVQGIREGLTGVA